MSSRAARIATHARGLRDCETAVGEVGALIASTDWSGSDIGPPEQWPASLCSAAALCWRASSPMAIFWGRRMEFLYNDACIALLGSKHPGAMGRPAEASLSELWPAIGHLIEGAIDR